jgi:hypothetical protein
VFGHHRSFSELKNRIRKELMMSKRDKYIIVVEGKLIEVEKEIYDVYYSHKRKEKYFMCDMKAGRRRRNKETGEIMFIPSIEDSLERLCDARIQFADKFDLENEVINKIMYDKLYTVLKRLSADELELIWYIFFRQVGETELARMYGIPRTTLQGRKTAILKKLKKFWVS